MCCYLLIRAKTSGGIGLKYCIDELTNAHGGLFQFLKVRNRLFRLGFVANW